MKPDATTSSRPQIGITMGDAAGIGAEIILKTLAAHGEDLAAVCRPVIIGDRAFLEKTAAQLDLPLVFTAATGRSTGRADEIAVDDLQNLPPAFELGQPSAATGRASAEYIERAVRLWQNGEIDAVATAPISKVSLARGGYDFPGHTEFLADLTDTGKFAMSFFAGRLRVVLLSTHVSLRRAIALVKKESLVDLIRFSHRELARLLKKDIRLAVAGLNPHASEDGMFGDEEAAEIAPAVSVCRDLHGIEVSGPYSPDTVFLRAHRGEFDGVIACYHDQATIAVKCLSFGASVNVTLGLPLIRTSVDHGTAFDIAGKNRADPSSMRAAIELAADLTTYSVKR